MEKRSVLFVCTGNSVRSQMAEALLRSLGGERFEVYSAGITPAGVHRFTKQVLNEIGIDPGNQYSKHIDSFRDRTFDYVIFLCEVAAATCPDVKANIERLHWFVDDPIRVIGNDERRLMAFRWIRNQLKTRIQEFIRQVTEQPAQ
jgi:arsenate reductase